MDHGDYHLRRPIRHSRLVAGNEHRGRIQQRPIRLGVDLDTERTQQSALVHGHEHAVPFAAGSASQ